MKLSKRIAAMAASAALALVAFAGVASAQTPGATFYGGGLKAGDKVEILSGTTSCGTATATAAGEWTITIDKGACAVDGAKLSTTLNGAATSAALTWKSGTLPGKDGNPGTTTGGIALTATGGAVTPPKTGDAGLLGGSSTAPWMALGLAAFALAALAGARAVTGRSR